MKDACTGCDETTCHCKGGRIHFYWPAVIVAAFIGVGLSFLCSLLALAFGFNAFSTDSLGATVFNVGGFVGLVIAAIISMFIVGWIAGYLARPFCIKKYYGELYGLTAWCLTLILSILLATSSEKLITHTSYLVNKNITPIVFTITTEKITNKVAIIKNNQVAKTNVDVLAMTSFVTFFLFFIGALASSFGGRCALQCRRGSGEKSPPL